MSSPARHSLTPPRGNTRPQARAVPDHLQKTSFAASSARRDLSTATKCMRAAWLLLEDATVLHQQACRLGDRGAAVLAGVSDELEARGKREKEAHEVATKAYEYSPSQKGPDTVFRVHS